MTLQEFGASKFALVAVEFQESEEDSSWCRTFTTGEFLVLLSTILLGIFTCYLIYYNISEILYIDVNNCISVYGKDLVDVEQKCVCLLMCFCTDSRESWVL